MESEILFLVMENQGGMSDVCEAYVSSFQNPIPGARLLILSENFSRRPGKNYAVIRTRSLLYPGRNLKGKLKKLIDSRKPSLIVTEPLVYPLVKDLGIPVVADVHYLMARSNKLTRRPVEEDFNTSSHQELPVKFQLLKKELSEKMMLRQSQFILANSQGTKSDILNAYPETLEENIKVVAVSNVIPPQDFTLPSSRADGFYYSGRFHPLKGVDILMRLSSHAQLNVLARGAPLPFMEVHKHFKKGFGFFNVHPWTYDKKKLDQESSSFRFQLFPSFYEPWGLSLTKSLRSGAICIANIKSSGHKEQIRDGVNGFLLDFEDPGLAGNILRIKNMPIEELDTIASRNKFSPEHRTEYVSEILKSLQGVIYEN